MEQDHYSCDEDDLDTFSSVSQASTYAKSHKPWIEENLKQVNDDIEADNVSRLSLASAGDVETSSQVARSIISGLFRKATGNSLQPSQDSQKVAGGSKAVTRAYSTSTRLDFDGSDCSDIEYQLGDIKEEATDTNSDVMIMDSSCQGSLQAQTNSPETLQQSEVHSAPSIYSQKSHKSILKMSPRSTSKASDHNKPEDEDRISELERSNSSFRTRITNWINNVSVNEKEHRDDARSVTFHDSIHCSTPVENVTLGDESDIFSSEDDQPSAFISPVKSLINTTREDTEMALDNVRMKFDAEAKTNISRSFVPDIAFSTFDQNFSKVQMSNGKELFDNGMIRNRLTGSYIKTIPFSECSVTPKNYHITITETMEQKMKLNKDGTQEIDTTHKREQSEKSFDKEDDKGTWKMLLKMLMMMTCILLFLTVIGFLTLRYFKMINIEGLHCFLDANGVPEVFRAFESKLQG